nr:MAG: polyprotein 2 [Picornavirales sp.]
MDQTFETAPEVSSEKSVPRFSYNDVSGDQLQEYLKRPRKIHSSEWVVGTSLLRIIKPWDLFFSLPDVKKKMAGYARFRGSLKLQILINGSSFHRGMVYASYLPLSGEDSSTGPVYNDGIVTTVTGSGVGQPNGAGYHSFGSPAVDFYGTTIGSRRLVPFSQRQHVKLYPSVGQGADMTLPLVFPHEYVPIDGQFLRPAVTPNSKLTSRMSTAWCLGALTMQSVGTLGFLGSNNPEAVDITILASLHDDYELVAPTTFELQAGPVPEAMSASISSAKPRSPPSHGTWDTVARVLGPAVARAMGFSNPPLLTNVDSLRICNVPNLANTQLSARDEVLAADPNATLMATCDSLGGDDSDWLITNLVSKESYLTSFTWPATGAMSPADTTLLRLYPSPSLSPVVLRAGSDSIPYEQVVPIPMEWVSECYRLWRGDLIFRFEVVTTKFQRGRLKVTFDPSGVQAADTDVTGKVYTKIFDISEGTEFEFVVPYMATTAWLATPHTTRVRPELAASAYNNVVPSAFEAGSEVLRPYDPSSQNGILTLQILNTLTNDLSAYVVVSVRAGSNFEFSVPCSVDPDISLQDQFFLQAGPVCDNYVGEACVSVRDLCHRSCPAASNHIPAINVGVTLQFPAGGMPRGVGLNSGDVQMKANDALYGMGSGMPVNFVHWFTSAFDSVRTSYRVQVLPFGVVSDGPTTNYVLTVVRGLSNFFLASDDFYTSSLSNSPILSRLAMSYTNQYGSLNGNSYTPMGRLLPIADSSSAIDSRGGAVLVPYQKMTKFSPTNSLYDFYRPVSGNASGTLIGEPVYAAGSLLAASMCMLSRFFTPQDSVRVSSSFTVGRGGTHVGITSAGSDLVVGRFCNAPTYFRSRMDGTFVRGSAIALNSLVAEKMLGTVPSVFTPIG